MNEASAFASATVSVWLCAAVALHEKGDTPTGDRAGASVRSAATIERPHR